MAEKNVIVELKALIAETSGGFSVESASGMGLPGLSLDQDFGTVPIPWDAPTTAELDVSSEQLYMVRGTIEEAGISTLNAQDVVHSVWIDTPIEPFIDCDTTNPKGTIADVATTLGVDSIWNDGFKGDGIVVGVVDGGITALGRTPKSGETAEIDRVIGGFPVADWGTTAAAWGRHGNMTATDVLGMAPEAKIYDMRISGGNTAQAFISNAIQAFDWAIAKFREDGTPQILSNSWGIFQEAWDADYATNSQHPFTKKVVQALDEGILVLFAAGNCGASCSDSRCGTDTGSGRSIWGANGHPRVMTVGAVNKNHELIGYSSQGPAALDKHKPDFCSISHFQGYFPNDTGTSAACPIAAGAVALLKQHDAALTQDRAKRAILTTALDVEATGWDTDTGAGVLQAKAAYDCLVNLGPAPAPQQIWGWLWTTGWTTMMPFVINGRPHFLGYKIETGEVTVDVFNTDGQGTETLWTDTWGSGWSTFMPFVMDDRPHYLAYNVQTGDVAIDAFKPDGGGIESLWASTWSAGWTTLAPFMMNGRPHYLAYKAGTGDVAIESVNDGGQGTTTVWTGSWSEGWTHFMPFDLNGTPHYIAYKADTGDVAIDAVATDGSGVSTIWTDTWTSGWSAFMPVVLDNAPHFLVYKPLEGNASLGRIRDDGVGVEGIWNGTWTGGWSAFVPFQLDGVQHHLLYKSGLGFVCIDQYRRA